VNHDEALKARARALNLYGLLAGWERIAAQAWVQELIEIEEAERRRRSLDRRVKSARLARFKPMADFDWAWPKSIDRQAIEELFQLAFVAEATNVVLVGPNGTGKSMIAQNIAHYAVLRGHTVRAVNASTMLNELAAQDGARGLQLALRRYCRPQVLICDEVGYLSYDNRHADLLFEVVTRRAEAGRPIVVTTNKAFAEWSEVFPNATCVVTIVDRLVHRSEVITIEGDSYRLKEARDQAAARARRRREARLEPASDAVG